MGLACGQPITLRRNENKSMNAEVYQFDISRADDAGTLHAYREDAANDDTLMPEEKAAVHAAIDRRFAFLNARAGGNVKPRW